MIRRYRKDPAATLDYTIDWSQWMPAGDSIVASTWTTTAGLTVVSDLFTGDTATAWVSGGVVDKTYGVTNKITTLGGRIDERTIVIDVENR